MNKLIDQELSNRFIDLDPLGYFLIKIDRVSKELIAEHYSNNINSKGVAVNPETGKPLTCSDTKRKPTITFRGKTAKEIGILITENNEITSKIISKLDHALYLGRELQKAENSLKNEKLYIQD